MILRVDCLLEGSEDPGEGVRAMERWTHACVCMVCRQNPRSETARCHAAMNRVLSEADEKSRRRIAGLEAMKMGWGGIQKVSEITGLSRPTISRGKRELRLPEEAPGRTRQEGGGRKPVEKKRRADAPLAEGSDA